MLLNIAHNVSVFSCNFVSKLYFDFLLLEFDVFLL